MYTANAVETWACPVSHRCSVGLPRLTQMQCGLAPSPPPAAVWAYPVYATVLPVASGACIGLPSMRRGKPPASV